MVEKSDIVHESNITLQCCNGRSYFLLPNAM